MPVIVCNDPSHRAVLNRYPVVLMLAYQADQFLKGRATRQDVEHQIQWLDREHPGWRDLIEDL